VTFGCLISRPASDKKLLRQIAEETELSHTSLRHIKHFLTGVFTFAKQESVINSENPMRDVGIQRVSRARIPRIQPGGNPKQ